MATSKKPMGPEDEAARARLLRAALDLFERKGYASTTVREIVEAAGVTKPVLYYYFGNKEGIYLTLFKEAYADILGEMEATARAVGSARDRILGLCHRAYAFHASHISLVRIMYANYYGPPQGAPPFDFDESHRTFHALTAGILQEGMASGELRSLPVEEAMWAVAAALNIVMEIDLCHPEQSLGREGLTRLLNTVFDGIAAVRPHPKRAQP